MKSLNISEDLVSKRRGIHNLLRRCLRCTNCPCRLKGFGSRLSMKVLIGNLASCILSFPRIPSWSAWGHRFYKEKSQRVVLPRAGGPQSFPYLYCHKLDGQPVDRRAASLLKKIDNYGKAGSSGKVDSSCHIIDPDLWADEEGRPGTIILETREYGCCCPTVTLAHQQCSRQGLKPESSWPCMPLLFSLSLQNLTFSVEGPEILMRTSSA